MEEQSTVNSQTSETVRIYREGMPSEGAVVSMEELAAMLSDGRLTGHDLIAVEGTWRPLDSVYEIPSKEQNTPIDEALPELTLELKTLPSVLAVGGGSVDMGQASAGIHGVASKKSSSVTVAVVVCVVIVIVAVVAWLFLKG